VPRSLATMADSQQDPNPPAREVPAFLQKLMKANDTVICTAGAADVKKATVEDLLTHRLRIPIFQRRYCWGKDQWDTLLDDALSVVDGVKDKHSLGRITCVKCGADDGRLLVIDGQQRNTTCTLLLSAIRDVAEHLPDSDPDSDEACQKLASGLNEVLLPDRSGLETWLSKTSPVTISEGEALDFAALVPTYCDRASYFAAILPSHVNATVANSEWVRPMEAKMHFRSRVMEFGADRLVSLAETVLHKLDWLYFPLDMEGGHEDGTEDLQVIFERLAVRDATWCKPSRATEFASMGAADFVRNLLLGSFTREAHAIDMYKQHWLPLEQAAAAASMRNQNSNIAQIMEGMLDAFLKKQPEKEASGPLEQMVVGGQLYPRFRKWLTAALAADISVVAGETQAGALERKTAVVLRRLQAFASEHFLYCDATTAPDATTASDATTATPAPAPSLPSSIRQRTSLDFGGGMSPVAEGEESCTSKA